MRLGTFRITQIKTIDLHKHLEMSTSMLMNRVPKLLLVIFIIGLALLITHIDMVKKEDFKKCDQSGFCRRQRAYAAIADKTSSTFMSPYELDPSSVQVDDGAGTLKADIFDRERNVNYILDVRLLKDATVRVRLREATPLYPRFDMLDALTRVGSPDTHTSIVNYNKTSTLTSPLRIQMSGMSSEHEILLVIQPKPFKFEFLIDGDPAMVFNGKGYLYYEHSRKKEEDPVGIVEQANGGESVPELSDLDRLKEELQRDLWEETFKSFTDSKPHGMSASVQNTV